VLKSCDLVDEDDASLLDRLDGSLDDVHALQQPLQLYKGFYSYTLKITLLPPSHTLYIFPSKEKGILY